MKKVSLLVLLAILASTLLMAAIPTAMVRLTIINKSGYDVYMKLEGSSATEQFYYLTIPAGDKSSPEVKVFTVMSDIYKRTTWQCDGVQSSGESGHGQQRPSDLHPLLADLLRPPLGQGCRPLLHQQVRQARRPVLQPDARRRWRAHHGKGHLLQVPVSLRDLHEFAPPELALCLPVCRLLQLRLRCVLLSHSLLLHPRRLRLPVPVLNLLPG